MSINIKNHIINTPVIDIVNRVKSQLTNGKLRSVAVKGSEVRVTCPHHGDGKEKNPDCYINSEGIYHCFACGDSGRLSKFVGECFDKDEQFGENWLLENFDSSLLYTLDESDLYDEFTLDVKDKAKEYLDESILNSFQSWHPYLDKRHIKRSVCERFKIKYDPKTECIVFPVYDENNKLYMLTRRSVKTKKFVIDSDKEKPIYLFNVIKNNNINEVTVVESQFNALTLYSWGIPAVALFGTGTQHQYDLLNKSQIQHYFLCFDGDSAGKKGISRFISNIRKDVFVDVIIMPVGKDVNDLTEEEFNQLKIVSSDEWRRKYENE